jgi:vacuolar protein sorting-associated protein 72
MLGCFVGPAEAARGVPERFSFARQQGPGTRILEHGLAESIDLPKAVPSTPTPAPHPPQAPGAMEVD